MTVSGSDRAHSTSLRPLLLWFAVVAATAGAGGWLFARGAGLAARTAVPATLLVGLALLERILPADAEHGWDDDPQFPCDLGHMIVGGWLAELGGSLLLGAVIVSLSAAQPWTIWPRSWPLAGQVALLLLTAEGLEYARHRFLHSSGRAWTFHRLHHDADRMHVWKGSRLHFGDLLSRFVVVFAPLAALGAPLELLPLYSLAILCLGPISHANLAIALPDWLHRVIVTPDVHRIHHARASDLSGANLAPILPLFDMIGGTFVAPSPDRRIEFGIEEPDAPTTFVAQLLRPFGDAAGADVSGHADRPDAPATVSPSPPPLSGGAGDHAHR